MKNEFTKDEIVALKEVAEEHIDNNLRFDGKKTNPGLNIFPEGYTGPRSFAEAMARKWDPIKQEWGGRR